MTVRSTDTLHCITLGCLLPYMAATANKRHSAAACYGRILVSYHENKTPLLLFFILNFTADELLKELTRGLEIVATGLDWTGYLENCLRYRRCYVASTPMFFSYRALSLHQAADCPSGLGSCERHP